MKTLALCLTGLAAFAGSLLTVSANNHPYTLPSFPAGPAIAPSPSTMQLDSVDAADVERRKPKTPVFEARLDGIYMNGKPFSIKGTSYFGFETGIYVPHGLWGGNESTSLQRVADFLKANNFNAVRLPFAVNGVLENLAIDPGLVTNEVELTKAFEGKTLRFLDVIDHTLKVLGDNKIVVMLDAHVLTPDLGITELWYTSDADKDNFEKAWKIMAKRYKNTWNVFAADLKNEPHGAASWGSGNVTHDWRLASLKLATTVLKIVPRWLIFVEGMSQSSRDVEGLGSFWGENLMDLQRAQLTLPVPNRLVYSPHVYGPDVYLQSYFLNETFPDNMPAIWDLHFGFGIGKYGPFVVGEWGGKYRSDADKKWQDKFAAYMVEKKLGWFYWCINPNSGDTEGLLDNDWNTPRENKLTMLSVFSGTPIP